MRPAAQGTVGGTPRFEILQRSAAPLLTADKPREAHGVTGCTWLREGNRWRMWYGASYPNAKRDDDAFCCYAESSDGLHWTKPELGLVEYAGNTSNNILFSSAQTGGMLPGHIFIDDRDGPAQRYRAVGTRFREPEQAFSVYGGSSADGIHWSFPSEPLSRQNSDTQTACIPEAGRCRLYTRMWTGTLWSDPGMRMVGYTESDHFGDFADPVAILRADDQDPAGMDFYSNAATKLADDLYVMFPEAFYATDQTIRCHLAWSRDGVHFARYGRKPVVDLGPDFDSGMVIVNPGAVPGDAPNTWWFYYFGTPRKHNVPPAKVGYAGGMGRFLLVTGG